MYAADRGAFTARFQVHSDHLEIQYSIRNTSATTFYVVDAAVIVGPHGETKVQIAPPAAQYLSPGTLILSDKLNPLPPGTRTTVPRSAYAFCLQPDETHTATVQLPLPLRDSRLPKSSTSPRTVSCTRVRLELGTIDAGGDLIAEEQEIAGTKVWRLNTAAYRQQHVLSVEAMLGQAVPLETE